MKKIIALCLLTFIFSCGSSDEVETVTVDHKYSLELPSFLSKGTGLHDDASLQYQNVFKEFYIVVIDEPKKGFIDVLKDTEYSPDLQGYYDVLTGGLEETIENINFEPVKDVQINGLKAKTFSITGTIAEKKLDIFYKIAYIEGKDSFYQIVTWTIKDSKDKYAPQMDKIIRSFKEIGNSRKADRSKK